MGTSGSDFKLNSYLKERLSNMSTTTMLTSMILLSLVTYASCLSCWHTGSSTSGNAVYTSMRATQVPVLMKNCTSPADKSCLKEWYNVGKISDIFYKLGCSEMAVAAEKETAMGTGERTVFTCNTNYCNTSSVMHPAMWLLGLAIMLATKQ